MPELKLRLPVKPPLPVSDTVEKSPEGVVKFHRS